MIWKVEKSCESFRRAFFEVRALDELSLEAKSDLDIIFASTTLGFRELLATVVFAKLLYDDYDPRTLLYGCKPRALYERYMRPVFRERGVPCGQSGPLNIAKGTERLNQQWAAGRRPAAHAQAMLRLVELVWKMAEKQVLAFARELGARFDALALDVKLTQANLCPIDSAAELSRVTHELINRFPLGGAIPQIVAGLAIEAEFLQISGAHVDGARDSVSTTNLTSGKAGDITVEINGELVRIYEVTVKPFTEQRVDECAQSIHSFFGNDHQAEVVVTVLCRPQDVPVSASPLHGSVHMGELIYGKIVFEFLNLYEWLAAKLVETPLRGRRYFFEQVQSCLNQPKIPTEIRQYWSNAFGDAE
jgi:hypothetical protein